jgi:hypothetical protein
MEHTPPNGLAWRVPLATSALRHRLHDPVGPRPRCRQDRQHRGVSTLAGYATGLSGKTFAFAILLNGPGV